LRAAYAPRTAMNDGKPSEHWLGSWCAAPQLTEPGNLPRAPLAHSTLRQVVCLSLDDRGWRARFSNAYDERPLELAAARIAPSLGFNAIADERKRALSFAGAPSAVVAANNVLVSDPFELELGAGERVALTLAFGDVPASVTGHPGSRTTSFLQAGHDPS